MLSSQTDDLRLFSERPMRKGTHSCFECRQRKVRCVSESHTRKCKGCSLKGLECTDQELHISRSRTRGEKKNTRDRVQELENKLDQVVNNQYRIDEDSRYRYSEGNSIEPSWRDHVAERGDPATGLGDGVSRKRRKVDNPALIELDAQVLKSRDSGDGPLLELFKGVGNSEICDRSPPGKVRGGLGAADESTHRVLQAFRLKVPNSRELMSILQAGGSPMLFWSEAFPDAFGGSENVSHEQLRDHIYRYLYPDNIADAARLMLCLALHIQQLPNDLETMYTSGPVQLADLQEHCMASAESLLASDEGCAATLSGLECMILQSEFYINLGNMRKVWLIVRRAINLAQLMGLHRKADADVDPSLAMRRKALWTELWQRERGFSLLMGLPHSTQDSHMPSLTVDDNTSDLQKTKRFLRDIGIVMGHIIERDQDPNGQTYSITLKIEEELEACQYIMSAQWWDFQPDPATPIDAIRGMFVAQLRFYTVQRLLHLPFLLKAFGDPKYEGSRLSMLKSSRKIINIFDVLRDEKRPVLKKCDMADFQVFAAAMTLVVHLLAFSRTSDSYDLHQEEHDWQLVLQTATALGRLSESMKGCDLATLGARVLNDFSNLRNGPVQGVYKVNIPYFGRVEIQRGGTRHNKYASYTQTSSKLDHERQSQQDYVGATEALAEPTVSLDSYLFPSPTATQPWQEADENWAHFMDSSMANEWSWFPSGDLD